MKVEPDSSRGRQIPAAEADAVNTQRGVGTSLNVSLWTLKTYRGATPS